MLWELLSLERAATSILEEGDLTAQFWSRIWHHMADILLLVLLHALQRGDGLLGAHSMRFEAMPTSFAHKLVVNMFVDESLTLCTKAQPTSVALDAHVPAEVLMYGEPRDYCKVEAISRRDGRRAPPKAHSAHSFSASPLARSGKGGCRPYAVQLRCAPEMRSATIRRERNPNDEKRQTLYTPPGAQRWDAPPSSTAPGLHGGATQLVLES